MDQESGVKRRKPAFTSRAAILAVVVAALAIALAAPVRELLSQRAQIGSLRSNVAVQQKQIADLKKTKQLWASPSYVEAQARDRLHYVFPGQIPFVTLSPTPAVSASALAAAALADQPWYGRLWSSVQGAAAVPPVSPTASPSPASATTSAATSPVSVPTTSPVPSSRP